MTNVFNTRHWTPFHFQQQMNSSDRLFFSSYGHISVVDITNGITNNTISHSTVVAGHKQHSGYIEHVGSAARFRRITGFDQNGTHIIAVDSGNHCIRTINIKSNKTQALAGTCCIAGYSDGPATDARFNSPQSIIKVKESKLQSNQYRYLITDRCNDAIRMITENGTYVETFIHLKKPIDLVMDQEGANLYVTTASRLVQINVISKVTLAISSLNDAPLKITPFTSGSFLISYKSNSMLTVFDPAEQTVKQICRSRSAGIRQDLAEGLITECSISDTYSVYRTVMNGSSATIIVGASKYITTLPVKCKP